MSLFTAKGEEATKPQLDLKKAFIRLKDGESVRVRIQVINDVTVGKYKAHSDYLKGIFTAPCIAPTGEECPYCVALNSGVEGWEKFYAKQRYLIVFVDIDTQAVRVWDASKQQGEDMLKLLKEYADSAEDMAFTLKRTGSEASDTKYHLMPILKLDAKGKELFEQAGAIEVPDNFLETALVPRTREQMIENLKKAGFPVEQFFGVVTEGAEETGEEIGEEYTEPIAEDETGNF